MKRTLTMTFTFIDEGVDNPVGYALDQVLAAIESLPLAADQGEGFIRAELDGALLVDQEGNAPEAVKGLTRYQTVLKSLKEG